MHFYSLSQHTCYQKLTSLLRLERERERSTLINATNSYVNPSMAYIHASVANGIKACSTNVLVTNETSSSGEVFE